MITRSISLMLLRASLCIAAAMILVSPHARSGALSYTAEFTSADIQARVDAMKPIKVQKAFFSMEMQEPKVALIAQSNEIAVSSSILIESTLLKSTQDPSKHLLLPARASIQAGLRYEPSEGAFYLLDPKVTALEIDKVPESMKPKARELAQALATQFFAKRPVFVLREDQIKQRLAKSVLQSVRVQGDKIIAVVGL